jgi:hypothetical protein
MIPAHVASPKFWLDQVVEYADHHGRIQSGTVTSIEAHWAWGKPDPLLIYTITHPSYRNRRCYRSEKEIIR